MRSTYLDEDDTLTNSQEVVQLDENLILVRFVAAVCTRTWSSAVHVYTLATGEVVRTHEELLDGVERQLLLLELNLVGLGCEPNREVANRVDKSSREQDNLAILGELCNQTGQQWNRIGQLVAASQSTGLLTDFLT